MIRVYAILGRDSIVAKKYGMKRGAIQAGAVSGDYDHLLDVMMKYFEVSWKGGSIMITKVIFILFLLLGTANAYVDNSVSPALYHTSEYHVYVYVDGDRWYVCDDESAPVPYELAIEGGGISSIPGMDHKVNLFEKLGHFIWGRIIGFVIKIHDEYFLYSYITKEYYQIDRVWGW